MGTAFMSKLGGFLGVLEGHDSHELQFGLPLIRKQLSLSKPISTCASSPVTVPSKEDFAVAGSQRRLPGNGAGQKKCRDSGSVYVFSEVRIKTSGWYHSLAPVSKILTSQGGLVFPLRHQPGHFY